MTAPGFDPSAMGAGQRIGCGCLGLAVVAVVAVVFVPLAVVVWFATWARKLARYLRGGAR